MGEKKKSLTKNKMKEKLNLKRKKDISPLDTNFYRCLCMKIEFTTTDWSPINYVYSQSSLPSLHEIPNLIFFPPLTSFIVRLHFNFPTFFINFFSYFLLFLFLFLIFYLSIHLSFNHMIMLLFCCSHSIVTNLRFKSP